MKVREWAFDEDGDPGEVINVQIGNGAPRPWTRQRLRDAIELADLMRDLYSTFQPPTDEKGTDDLPTL